MPNNKKASPSYQRIYNVPDAVLLEAGSVIAYGLKDDMANFMAFDNAMPADMPVILKDMVDRALSSKTDSLIRSELAEHTQIVLEKMGECEQAYRTIMFFIHKAFQGNKAMINQFGKKDFLKARTKQSEMIVFMDNFTATVEKYKGQIHEAGCSNSILDELPKLSEQLRECNIKQDNFKRERSLLAKERIELLNNIYLQLKQFREISKIIYANDRARLKKYKLPRK